MERAAARTCRGIQPAAGECDEAVVLPYEPSWSRAVYHLYVVRTDDREGMMDHLKKAGIGTGIHYPIPLHLQKAYASLNYAPGDFPVAERARRNRLLADVSAPDRRPASPGREEILAFTSNPTRKHAETESRTLAAAEQTA